MDLIADIKSRLTLEKLISGDGAEFALKPAGPGKLMGVEHDSLQVDVGKQLWSWFSQPGRAGQKVLGGDLFDWISFRRLNRLCRELARDEFVEQVLHPAADLAGLKWEEYNRQDPAAKARAAHQREVEETLELYVQACEKARDADRTFASRVVLPVVDVVDGRPVNRVRKPYLTPEICQRWRIGKAATLKQCLDVGLDEKRMRAVGILRDSQREGPDQKPYMHFRDRFIIPFLHRGRVLYVCGRAFQDTIPGTDRVVKKMLYLPKPQNG